MKASNVNVGDRVRCFRGLTNRLYYTGTVVAKVQRRPGDMTWLHVQPDSVVPAVREYGRAGNHSPACPTRAADGLVEVAMMQVDAVLPRAPKRLRPCQCADRACPMHKGNNKCDQESDQTLYRRDMDDLSGTRFCPGCAEDALETSLFALENGSCDPDEDQDGAS